MVAVGVVLYIPHMVVAVAAGSGASCGPSAAHAALCHASASLARASSILPNVSVTRWVGGQPQAGKEMNPAPRAKVATEAHAWTHAVITT